MNCPGRAVRLLPMVTVKPGGPIERASAPPCRLAQAGRRRRDDQPDRRGGRLGMRGLAQQEDRPPARLCPAMQPARRRQVERAAGCRAVPGGPPTSAVSRAASSAIHSASASFGASRQQHVLRRDAEAGLQPGRIGKAGLAKDLRRADPQERRPVGPLLQRQADQRQREPGRGPGIAGLGPVDLGQRGLGQPAAQRRSRSSTPVGSNPPAGTAMPCCRARCRTRHAASPLRSSRRSASRPSIFAICRRKAKTVPAPRRWSP